MAHERIVVDAGTGYPLPGLLELPDDLSAPVPAVVMVQGSGASNMDEQVMKLTPFKDLAEGLRERGVASIRFDKRTFARSFSQALKLRKLKPTVWDESIEDALFAIGLAKSCPRIDPDRVFILGHSQGAMLAPRIDAEGGNVRGLIMMAGSPYRLEQIVLRQLEQTAKGDGNPILKWIVGLELKIYGKRFDGLYEMDDETARKKKFAGSLSLYYFKEMGRKTASDYLLESDKPALIMQGGRDFQSLADDDFKAFQSILKDREDTEFRLYPSLNHCFVEAMYDDILKVSKEYGVERHIGDDVIDDIASFIERVG